jgi:hypothetical protein
MESFTGKIKIFKDTVLRRDTSGKLYIMNHPEKGWSSSSYEIASEESLVEVYDVKLGEWSKDKFGEYCPVLKCS